MFLKSLHQTLIFYFFLRVLTKPLAHRLQTRWRASACLSCPLRPGVFLCCSSTWHALPGDRVGLLPQATESRFSQWWGWHRRRDERFRPSHTHRKGNHAVPAQNIQSEGVREGGGQHRSGCRPGPPVLSQRPPRSISIALSLGREQTASPKTLLGREPGAKSPSPLVWNGD